MNKEFKLLSETFKEGEKIEENHYTDQFDCIGKNERPAFQWINVPSEAKSFAITFFDEDAPTGSGFWHWVVYNIPANITKINSDTLPAEAIEPNTDLEKPGFFGPCPPVGRIHRYTFTLHALDVKDLAVPQGSSGAISRFYINKHTIAKTTLTGIAGPRK